MGRPGIGNQMLFRSGKAILAIALIVSAVSAGTSSFWRGEVMAQKQTSRPMARRTLWVSPSASSASVTSREGVVQLCERAQRAGFDAIILYVKELNGQVIYPSRIAPRLLEYKGVRFPSDFDPLKAFIEETHKRGMRLHAGLETFTEGNKVFPGVGVGYTTHKEWQTVAYDIDEDDKTIKRAPWGEFKQGIPLFVNAALPEVQNYELSIVKEVLEHYDVDAVVFDRARWQGINSDFSDYSRTQFAAFVKDPNLKWPQDVYKIKLSDKGAKEIVEGRYYKQWLEWRATVIHDYFARLHRLVRETKPRVSLEDYVGSWYPVYNELGVNWASAKHVVPYKWATPNYGKTGYAEFLDVLYVGLYYPHATEREAIAAGSPVWRSVEGAAKLALEITKGATTVQGVINYGDDNLSFDQLEAQTGADQQVLGGVSVFETSHVNRRNLWPFLTTFLHNTDQPRGTNE
jgi:uncharacterized lipoprotein YddW (UPF0748 family)